MHCELLIHGHGISIIYVPFHIKISFDMKNIVDPNQSMMYNRY